MPRFLPWVALCAFGALLPLVAPACTSSGDDDSASPGNDAGGTIDQEVPVDDSGPVAVPEAEPPVDSSFVKGACHTTAGCDPGAVCGFPSDGSGGCSVIGTCVLADPPTTDSGAVLMACGCNGKNAPYVTPTMTSIPVVSSSPCVDAGAKVDGGGGGDASIDGSIDASDGASDSGSDASDAASTD